MLLNDLICKIRRRFYGKCACITCEGFRALGNMIELNREIRANVEALVELLDKKTSELQDALTKVGDLTEENLLLAASVRKQTADHFNMAVMNDEQIKKLEAEVERLEDELAKSDELAAKWQGEFQRLSDQQEAANEVAERARAAIEYVAIENYYAAPLEQALRIYDEKVARKV